MKKTFALLAALMLVVMMLPTSAMAYTAVTPTTTLQHTLALTNPSETSLDGTITYSFAVGDMSTEPANAFANISQAVSGSPTIGDLVYNSSDTFTERQCTKDLPISWSGVSFMEPGVYKWPVTKTYTATGTNKQPSNNAENFYLYVYVTDTNGTLTTAVIMTTAASGDQIDEENKGNLNDSYPARTVDLVITKNVTGNQGSKDQYFKFEIQLQTPSGVTTQHCAITGLDPTLPESAYTPANTTPITNPEGFDLVPGQLNKVTLWMKHNQTATISGLYYGTAYTITETAEGYTISTSRKEGAAAPEIQNNKNSVSDTRIQANTTVTYTNDKNAEVPTGITLHTAAPVMGLMLAMSLLAILYLGKRKEAAA